MSRILGARRKTPCRARSSSTKAALEVSQGWRLAGLAAASLRSMLPDDQSPVAQSRMLTGRTDSPWSARGKRLVPGWARRLESCTSVVRVVSSKEARGVTRGTPSCWRACGRPKIVLEVPQNLKRIQALQRAMTERDVVRAELRALPDKPSRCPQATTTVAPCERSKTLQRLGLDGAGGFQPASR